MAAKQKLRTPFPIVVAPEPPREVPVAFAPRESFRGILFSGAVHLAVLIVLSLIVMSQSQEPPTLTAEIRFDDEEGVDDSFLLTPELAATDAESLTTGIQRMDADLMTGGTPVDSPLQVDLSAFSSAPGSDSQLSDTVARMAAGIQDRVQKAGGKTGEVQFSLSWHSLNDLDLHVITPSGEHVSYSHKTSRCRGALDVDMNVVPTTDMPVENVRWLSKSAPMGRFTILVHQYHWREGRAVDNYELLANLGGRTELLQNRVRPGRAIAVHRFQYVRPSLSERRQKELAEELTELQEREERQASAMLEKALPLDPGKNRDQMMARIILQFPHTDASLRAMQELQPELKEGPA